MITDSMIQDTQKLFNTKFNTVLTKEQARDTIKRVKKLAEICHKAQQGGTNAK